MRAFILAASIQQARRWALLNNLRYRDFTYIDSEHRLIGYRSDGKIRFVKLRGWLQGPGGKIPAHVLNRFVWEYDDA